MEEEQHREPFVVVGAPDDRFDLPAPKLPRQGRVVRWLVLQHRPLGRFKRDVPLPRQRDRPRAAVNEHPGQDGLSDDDRGLRLRTVEELDDPHRREREQDRGNDAEPRVAQIERPPHFPRHRRRLEHPYRRRARALGRFQLRAPLDGLAMGFLELRELLLQRLVLVEARRELADLLAVGGHLLLDAPRRFARGGEFVLGIPYPRLLARPRAAL